MQYLLPRINSALEPPRREGEALAGAPVKPFTTATLIILALVAIVHALRLVMGGSVIVNGSDVPMWVSAVALVVFAGLAVGLWREMRA